MKGKRQEKFAKAPHNLLEDTRLTATDKIVYIALRSFAFGTKIECWAGLEKLSKRSNIDKKNLSRHLKKLEELKYICIAHRKNTSNMYYFLPIFEDSKNNPSPDATDNSQVDDERIVNATTSHHQDDDSAIVDMTTVHHHTDDLPSSQLRWNNTKEENNSEAYNLESTCVVSPEVETTTTLSWNTVNDYEDITKEGKSSVTTAEPNVVPVQDTEAFKEMFRPRDAEYMKKLEQASWDELFK
jgi:DNA-binding transcriptional ArsR family regulator